MTKAVSTKLQQKKINTVYVEGQNIRIKDDSDLANAISEGLIYENSSREVRKFKNRYPISWLIPQVDRLRRNLEVNDAEDVSVEPFKSFFEILDLSYAELREEAMVRLNTGVSLLSDLLFHFHKGAEIIVGRGADAVGGTVIESEIVHSLDHGPYILIDYSSIANVSGHAQTYRYKTVIWQDKHVMTLSALKTRIISAAERDALTNRGRIFREFGTDGPRHAAYTGMLAQPSWGSDRLFRSDGRIMIDAKAMERAASSIYRDLQTGEEMSNRDELEDVDCPDQTFIITDDDLWQCSPYLLGFSFSSKQWGKLSVNTIKDIAWRTDAFEKLVLPPDDKHVVHALVKHSEGAFTDIIDGKGGGTIFLLHGQPGQGKTLLAETVAETLQRPLYTIGVGELGISPDILEERLRDILDLASVWNAVLLLDEADIFLEARNEHDIVRNAMVGVFLRLLEYHNGNLFLTTNRVKNIDPAFYSRIAIALQFDGADQAKLQAIWNNLLAAAGIEGIDTAWMAKTYNKINGRQIKNAIRLAQTLAKAQSETVTEAHLIMTIDLGTRFMVELTKQ